MTEREAVLTRAAIRAAQICAVLAVLVVAVTSPWWMLIVYLLVVPVLVWAWQVLYENVP